MCIKYTNKKNGRKNMIENKKLSGQRVPIGTLTKGSMANCSHTKPHKLGRCLMNRSKLPKKRFKQNKNTRNQSNQSTDFFDQPIKPINAMKPIKAIKPGRNRPHPGRFLSSLVGGSSDNQFY